jgi:orotidine-5'-phosphate decarboxylase
MRAVSDPRLIVALDFAQRRPAVELVAQLSPTWCRLKIGKELFTRAGPAFVEQLANQGFEIFLDLKFHDIPNTVAAACAQAADMGVWMINVHASGGRRMMQAARARLESIANRPLLIGVTVLTSMERADLEEIGIHDEPVNQVTRLARLTQQSGLDGVVCSPLEAAILRAELGEDFFLVTPGVRPLTALQDDQRRVMTPAQAVAAGADYLVIGRPITGAADPLAALQRIAGEMTPARHDLSPR